VSFTASLDKYVSLESVLPRETLVTMAAWEWLHSKMNALVSLQVVISVEALRALVATEWPVVSRVRMATLVSVHLLHLRHMAAVHGHRHLVGHVADKRELSIRIVDI